MGTLLEVVLPVFLVMGFGYVAVWRGYFTDAGVDALMRFTQGFAIPCLLFRAISGLDLEAALEPALLLSFYAGATGGFAAGLLGARLIFGRPWQDAVAIGFVGLYSNSVLLGLPITERAYGPDALEANFALVAFHAPFCYALGVTVMEIVRGRGRGGSALATARKVTLAIVRNALVIAIALGFAVNLSGLQLPVTVEDGVALVARAALPAALFGLGGVLVRYRPEGDLKTIVFIVAISLVLHPAITWGLGKATGLERDAFRSAVLTAAMAPGVNTYIFASIYGVARRVAASAVLLGTAASIVTVWLWLLVLP